MKENEIGRKCGTYGREERCVLGFSLEKARRKLGEFESILLKWVLKKQVWRVWSRFTG
jgi:hypothetical protein